MAIINTHAEGVVFLLNEYDWSGPFTGRAFDNPVTFHFFKLIADNLAICVRDCIRWESNRFCISSFNAVFCDCHVAKFFVEDYRVLQP